MMLDIKFNLLRLNHFQAMVALAALGEVDAPRYPSLGLHFSRRG